MKAVAHLSLSSALCPLSYVGWMNASSSPARVNRASNISVNWAEPASRPGDAFGTSQRPAVRTERKLSADWEGLHGWPGRPVCHTQNRARILWACQMQSVDTWETVCRKPRQVPATSQLQSISEETLQYTRSGRMKIGVESMSRSKVSGPRRGSRATETREIERLRVADWVVATAHPDVSITICAAGLEIGISRRQTSRPHARSNMMLNSVCL